MICDWPPREFLSSSLKGIKGVFESKTTLNMFFLIKFFWGTYEDVELSEFLFWILLLIGGGGG